MSDYTLCGGPFPDGIFFTPTSRRCSILTSSAQDGALGDVGEALIPQSRRNLVAVRGSAGQDREDMPSGVPLSISVICLPMEHPLPAIQYC
ncbi:hypothetical protein ACSNOB_27905 [Micromonospora sp. URMC 106]|uniref:hypothetical protein n=1 Tax=Micromonospora sp. URMC 106 TaxID=3423408 RepID=UPI003F1DE655